MNVKSVNALICFLMVLFEACKLVDGLRNIRVRLDVPPSVPHRTSEDKNDPCKADRILDMARSRTENFIPRYRQTRHRRRHRRAATAESRRKWTYGVIPFVIDEQYSGEQASLFKQAMRHWENLTCVTFIEKEYAPEFPNYIYITVGPCGCCSFVGMKGDGRQDLSLGKRCDKFGIAVHELGHAIGFWHEHTRPDRDDYIDLLEENVQDGQLYNFDKMNKVDVESFDEPYDFASVMHYSSFTFSKSSRLETLVPKKSHWIDGRPPEIGQRLTLSNGDIRQTKKLYGCPGCGKTLMNENGTLSSPFSEKAARCVWRIVGSPGDKVILNITRINIKPSDGCRYDYLEVREGFYHGSKLIGRFCGRTPPPTITSSTTRLWVSYRASSNRNDFKANYELRCGGNIGGVKGEITSPNYPNLYFNNKDCIWRITVSENAVVGLRINNLMLERHEKCLYDFLEIRDGHSNTSKIIGRYCSHHPKAFVVRSKTNRMSLRFVSDASVEQPGFSGTYYEEVDECSGAHGCESICVNTLGSYHCECHLGFDLLPDGKSCAYRCGGRIEQSSGVLQSPNYPELYPTEKTCIWEIVAPKMYKITLNFTHFDVEGVSNSNCTYDSLQVFSGSTTDKHERKASYVTVNNSRKRLPHLHSTLCGYVIPRPITSLTNVMTVKFKSDYTIAKTGFVGVFTTDFDECEIMNGGCGHGCKNVIGSYQCYCLPGYVLHSNKHDCKEGLCKHDVNTSYGHIMSHNYPEPYDSRRTCVWNITCTNGHRVKLAFTDFELEKISDNKVCKYDYIKIFDGPSDVSSEIGKYCGVEKPPPILSSSNHMFIRFFTDTSVQKKGFHAIHSTVCGGKLLASFDKSRFYSHSTYGDNNYSSKQSCEWTIYSDIRNARIKLRFVHFDVEKDTNCNYDYVELYDGREKGKAFGRYCGMNESRLQNFISSSNYMLVLFKTDDTIHKKGFVAEYSLADDADTIGYHHF